METQELSFQDMLPQLAGLYRQDLLVPFIGAGMSYGICCGWEQLLRNLAKELKIPVKVAPAADKLTSAEIIRVADGIVSALRPLKTGSQVSIYQGAILADPVSGEIPKQTGELARLYWPLVITTNYDDVYWTAACRNAEKNNLTPVEGNRTHTSKYKCDILGRSVEDCQAVLRSLDGISSPQLWAIQGFLGGQLSNAAELVPDPQRRIELANQVVLGHQQYQKAINNSLQFRRAFAEVYRRRSLLFLGSGILEDYLVNLFSEILQNQGCGPHPHFALLKRSEKDKYDNLFMQQRLGIVPIFYDEYKDVAQYLNDFVSLIKYQLTDLSVEKSASPFIYQDEIGFRMAGTSARGTIPIKVSLCKDGLPVPHKELKECSVVSVGRYNNVPLPGDHAKSHLIAFEEKYRQGSQPWISVDERPSYVFRYGNTAVYAIAARRRDSQTREHDTRDLGIIPAAVVVLLQEIDKAGFHTVFIGPVAAGKDTFWDTIHPFAQTLQGIRQFLGTCMVEHLKKIQLYVENPGTWSGVITRKISLEGLLTSAISTHMIETRDPNGTVETYNITLKELPTLEELLKLCKLDSDQWHVTVFPLPADNNEAISPRMLVTSTMKVILSAK